MTNYTTSNGLSYPLGATIKEGGINFAIFSANAKQIELCLFDDETGNIEQTRIKLPKKTNNIWHVFVHNLKPNTKYGYRVYGEYNPDMGLRFNHHKLLIDPYAKNLDRPLKLHNSMYSYNLGQDPNIINDSDSAPYMPKGIVIEELPDCDNTKYEHIINNKNNIIYECHIKNVTQLLNNLKEEDKGKFSALVNDNTFINHINSLGINTVEFLPIQYYADETHLLKENLTNHWGYNTINFFCPHNEYYNNFSDIFKAITKLKDNNIKPILDVVYNHTGEGDHLGPTLSYKGIDNLSYYRLDAHQKKWYENSTGCGNSFNLSNDNVLQLVMDSLRYWTKKFGVLGFRFDLASNLLRDSETNINTNNSAILHTIQQDPTLKNIELIAEPWDIGYNGYQVSNFPQNWKEWNDKFRDIVRSFWNCNNIHIGDFTNKICGSQDIFYPYQSNDSFDLKTINFITSHDGFTLEDLVSHNFKHNEHNKENNNDGNNNNISNNYGHEGKTDNPEINKKRLKQKKNLITSLMLSVGTPMMLAGDELGNSQNGNNNAYCQDNNISWIDWDNLKKDNNNNDFFSFVKQVIKLRKKITNLNNNKLFSNNISSNKIKETLWIYNNGDLFTQEHWNNYDLRDYGLILNDVLNKKLFLMIYNNNSFDMDFKITSLLKIIKNFTCKEVLNTAENNHTEKNIDQNELINKQYINIKENSIVVIEFKHS